MIGDIQRHRAFAIFGELHVVQANGRVAMGREKEQLAALGRAVRAFGIDLRRRAVLPHRHRHAPVGKDRVALELGEVGRRERLIGWLPGIPRGERRLRFSFGLSHGSTQAGSRGHKQVKKRCDRVADRGSKHSQPP